MVVLNHAMYIWWSVRYAREMVAMTRELERVTQEFTSYRIAFQSEDSKGVASIAPVTSFAIDDDSDQG